jgi:hypothetical protein
LVGQSWSVGDVSGADGVERADGVDGAETAKAIRL